MKVLLIYMGIGLITYVSAQKKHAGQSGGKSSQNYPSHPQSQNYDYSQNSQHYNPHSAPSTKPSYPLLLSDSRTLNNDGTINFQYAADNGLQQGESVDPDGTRRGFYSYPGADGKPITVKYTAGKNGFVAEGDHLPRQPNAAPHGDEKKSGGQGPYGGSGENYDAPHRPAYNPSYPRPQYSQPQRPHSVHNPYSSGSSPVKSPYGGESNYDDGQYDPAKYGSGEYEPKQNNPPPPPPPRYSSGGQNNYAPHGGHRLEIHSQPQVYPGGQRNNYGGGGDDFGTYRPSAATPPQHISSIGGSGSYSAASPFQQGGAGPYSGRFDLGNGGHYSINFNPGQPQEVSTGGDYSGHFSPQSQSRY